jgi:hypothetical protein
MKMLAVCEKNGVSELRIVRLLRFSLFGSKQRLPLSKAEQISSNFLNVAIIDDEHLPLK